MVSTILEKLKEGNIFLEASAGTGKTYTIVEIVINLLEQGYPISRFGIITFTEKAAGELSIRLREKLESKLKDLSLKNELHFQEQLQELPFANIGTIHNFCRKLLSKYPQASDFFSFKKEERDVSFEIRKAFELYLEKKEKEAIESNQTEKFIQFFLDFEVLHLNDFCREIIDKTQLGKISFPEKIEHNSLQTEFSNLIKKILDKYQNSKLSAYKEAVISQELFQELKNNRILTERHILNRTTNRELINDPDFENWNVAWQDLKSNMDYFSCQDKIFELIQFFNDWIQFYKDYQKQKNFLSTDDVICNTVEMLQAYPQSREHLSKDFDFLIVDECQDTDPNQFLIFSLLNSVREGSNYKTPKLILVGDKKQSIYKFRNADLKTVNSYVTKLILSQNQLRLNTSYRSREKLNAFFNDFFSQNAFEQFKYSPVKTGREDELAKLKEPSVFLACLQSQIPKTVDTVRKENAESIVQFIQEIYNNEHYLVWDKYKQTQRTITFSDIAILSYNGRDLETIQKYLLLKKVPCSIYKEKTFYSENLIASLSYMLHSIENPNDSQSFLFALDSPLFLIPVPTLCELSSENLLNYYQVVLPEKEEYKELIEIYKLFSKAHEERFLYPASLIIQNVLERMNTLPRLASGFEGRKNLTNLYHFYDILNEMQYDQNMSFGEIAREMRRRVVNEVAGEKRLDYEEKDKRQDTVKLMTIHASKGLEFPVCVLFRVFKTRWESSKANILKTNTQSCNGDITIEFRFKSNVTLQTLGYKSASKEDMNADNEEEARLIYVACTRARDYLFFPINYPSQIDHLTDFSKNLINLLNLESDFVKNCLNFKLVKIFEPKAKSLLLEKKEEEKSFSFHPEELQGKWEKAIQNIANVSSWKIVSYSRLHRDQQRIEPKQIQSQSKEEGKQFHFENMDGKLFGKICHAVLEKVPFEKITSKDFLEKGLVEICEQTYEYFGVLTTQSEYSLETLVNLTRNALVYNYIIDKKEAPICKWEHIHKERKFYANGESLGDWIVGIADVLFKLKDKYYILDWKTDQHIGESLKTHCEKEYNNQVYLYSYVLLQNLSLLQKNKSLKTLYDKQFGGMVFVFLRYLGTEKGLYFIKPNLEEVLNFIKMGNYANS